MYVGNFLKLLRSPTQQGFEEGCLENANPALVLLYPGVLPPYVRNIIGIAQSVGERSNFKKILRTRKIMVMHSNERGEYCPRTLVDRKRKRYDNAVDVVARLHDPTDPSTECTAPPSSAHIQPDDVPRTLIQPSVEGEFCQHDGVVMMMMFYRRRAFPKHRYGIIEVEYGRGGTAHG